MMGTRGIVGERWSQRLLWFCAIGSAISLYIVAVERQAQNRKRAMAESLRETGTSSQTAGEEV